MQIQRRDGYRPVGGGPNGGPIPHGGNGGPHGLVGMVMETELPIYNSHMQLINLLCSVTKVGKGH